MDPDFQFFKLLDIWISWFRSPSTQDILENMFDNNELDILSLEHKISAFSNSALNIALLLLLKGALVYKQCKKMQQNM